MVEVVPLGQQAAQVFFALVFLFLSQTYWMIEGSWSLGILVVMVTLGQPFVQVFPALVSLFLSQPSLKIEGP